jgi:16S rRNA (cytosine967-C5)-methyltransferase
MMAANVREMALDLLLKVEREKGYSNLVLNRMIEKYKPSPPDAALLTEIAYGTIQRKLTLEYFLAPFVKKPDKLDHWVKLLLLLSLYQMKYLTKVPDHAVIYEAVAIAKKRGHRGIAAFVNGVLRSAQRKGLPSFDPIADPLEKLSVETSHPLWLVRDWAEQFGLETTAAICRENLEAPRQTARINGYLTDAEAVLKRLEEEGIKAEKSDAVPDALRSVKGNLAKTGAYEEGLLTIQDESSMLAGYAVDPKEGETILDACAAPGGKATHLGERMNNTGTIIALDVHKHKTRLIAEHAKRLGLTNISVRNADAREAGKLFAGETFDKVLVDAPCSGLGVLKRKPEIKYMRSPEDVKKLAEIQLEILDAAAPLVKKGGFLVYSTCTIHRRENQEVARAFLAKHPEFAEDRSLRSRMPAKVRPFVAGFEMELLPQHLKSDGFYIACFKKKV